MPGTPIQPTPQPPQPPQPTPHRQALHPAQPRQPPHPRKPPPPHPRQPPHPPHPRASCTPLRRFSSSSKRRKVARLTSAISSSPSVIIMPGAKFAPVEHRPSVRPMHMRFLLAKRLIPRRPTPVLRFWLLASFSKLASPEAWSHPPTCCEKDIRRQRSYADQIRQARFMRTRKCNDARSDCIHLHERCRRIFVHCNDGPRP